MADHRWVEEFAGSIIVCDTNGKILDMNLKSAQSNQAEGGKNLIGRNVFDCHPEPARLLLKELIATQKPNVYTVEKNGLKKLVYQTPWSEKGQYSGFVEIILELPSEMPHHVRPS